MPVFRYPSQRIMFQIVFPCLSPRIALPLSTSFFSPRVSDIVFCLERTTETFGPQYTVHERNCWSFAAFFFRVMSFLFKLIPRKLVTCPRTVNNFVRKRFISVPLPSGCGCEAIKGHPRWFNLINLCGVHWQAEMTDSKFIIQKDPFRVLFLWVVMQYLPIHDLESVGCGWRHVLYDAMCLAFSQGLSSVFIDSGGVTFLKTLIQRYFSNCGRDVGPGRTVSCQCSDFAAWQILFILSTFVERRPGHYTRREPR